jgi:hypothetical protein
VWQISYGEAVRRVKGVRGHSAEEDMEVDVPQPVVNVLNPSSDLDAFIVKKVNVFSHL